MCLVQLPCVCDHRWVHGTSLHPNPNLPPSIHSSSSWLSSVSVRGRESLRMSLGENRPRCLDLRSLGQKCFVWLVSKQSRGSDISSFFLFCTSWGFKLWIEWLQCNSRIVLVTRHGTYITMCSHLQIENALQRREVQKWIDQTCFFCASMLKLEYIVEYILWKYMYTFTI